MRAILALALGVVSFGSAPASAAKPAHHFPERDVTIEFVRVLSHGGPHESGAVPLDQLDPVVRSALRSWVPNSEAKLFKLLKKQTIHLGEPHFVSIGQGQRFEFRRVGIRAGWVECATLDNGVVVGSSSRYSKDLAKHPFVCGSRHFGSDVYVVAWVPIKEPAPTPLAEQVSQ